MTVSPCRSRTTRQIPESGRVCGGNDIIRSLKIARGVGHRQVAILLSPVAPVSSMSASRPARLSGLLRDRPGRCGRPPALQARGAVRGRPRRQRHQAVWQRVPPLCHRQGRAPPADRAVSLARHRRRYAGRMLTSLSTATAVCRCPCSDGSRTLPCAAGRQRPATLHPTPCRSVAAVYACMRAYVARSASGAEAF